MAPNYSFWLKRPELAIHRAKYEIWQRLHPDSPWWCPGTVRKMHSLLTPSMRIVEFGTGRSTIWLAARCEHLMAIEHDSHWYRKVKDKLAKNNLTNVDLRLIPLDHAIGEPEKEIYDPTPSYVAILDEIPPESLDIAIIDGAYRTTCVKAVIQKMRTGGMLLVDDAERWDRGNPIPAPQLGRK